MRTYVISGALGVILVLLGINQAGPDYSQDILELRKELATLGLRVDQLEHASGVSRGSGPTGAHGGLAHPEDAAAGRTMVFTGMSEGRQADHSEEIADLQDDHDALMDTVNYHKDNSDRIASDTGYWYGNRDRRIRGRREDAQQNMASRYSTQAAIKKEKIDKLQAADKRETQIITGHAGEVVFTLRTKHDLSDELSKISIGDTVTWAGTRTQAGNNSETWEISSIHKVED